MFAAAKAKLGGGGIKPLTSDYDSNESPSGSELTIDEQSTATTATTATSTSSSSYYHHHKPLSGSSSLAAATSAVADKCFYLAKADSIGESVSALGGTGSSPFICSQCGGRLSGKSASLGSNRSSKKTSLRWPFVDLPPPLVPSLNAQGHFLVDGVVYDLEAIRRHELLSRLHQWDYPIFELAEELGESILSTMSFTVFEETRIMEAFRIPIAEYLHYFHALENGYRHKPCKC